MDTQDTHTMQVRMPKRLWLRFQAACRNNDTNPSEAVREFVRMFSMKEDQVREIVERADEGFSNYISPSGVAGTVHSEKRTEAEWLRGATKKG